MEPSIKDLKEIKLAGRKARMSFANNKTRELWQSFMPGRKEIKNIIGAGRYSVEVYNDTEFFINFNPEREFEKWAVVRVNDFDNLPDGMEALTIPAGKYAVFIYKGRPGEAEGTYRYILGTWLPGSEYKLDDRPHFAYMGERYKGDDPDSEEEIWIPVKKK
jgi:AraC family transcriptional regulator